MYILLKPLFSRHKGIGVQFTDEPTGNLDTKSGQVVIDSLVQIHQKFEKTIVIVSVGRFSPFRVGLKTPISVNLKSPMHHVCY